MGLTERVSHLLNYDLFDLSPIRIGDVIQIDQTVGVVEDGGRCIRMRTYQGIQMFVPNSALLHNKVTNWTYSTDKILTEIKVGVAYGSPTDTVVKLMKQAVTDIPEIHSDPSPVVLFTDFGDSTLNFAAAFWISMKDQMEVEIIQSNVRLRLDELFRENQIVVSFQQRDVHLDAPRPIDVRVLQGPTTSVAVKVAE